MKFRFSGARNSERESINPFSRRIDFQGCFWTNRFNFLAQPKRVRIVQMNPAFSVPRNWIFVLIFSGDWIIRIELYERSDADSTVPEYSKRESILSTDRLSENSSNELFRFSGTADMALFCAIEMRRQVKINIENSNGWPRFHRKNYPTGSTHAISFWIAFPFQ